MSLPKRQHMILKHIIEETKEQCAPTLTRLTDISGVSYAIVRAAVIGLEKKGYIKHPYKAGPYVPVRDLNGEPMQWGLLPTVA